MADFAYSPDFTYKVTPKFNSLVSTFENKVEQRRLKTSQKLRLYEFPFTNRSATEWTAVDAFFTSKNGAVSTFTVNVDGADILGRFVEGSYYYQRVGPAVYNYFFNFQEVVNAS